MSRRTTIFNPQILSYLNNSNKNEAAPPSLKLSCNMALKTIKSGSCKSDNAHNLAKIGFPQKKQKLRQQL